MNNKIIKNTIATLIISLILMTLCILLFVFSISKINKISNNILKAQEDIAFLKDISGRMIALSRSQNSLKEAHDKLDIYYITENSVPDFLSEIENYGKSINTSVDFQMIDKNNTKSNSIIIKINAEGNFKSILNFTNYLETLPYYTKFNRVFLVSKPIENIVVDPKSKTPTLSNVWKAEYSLEILSFIPTKN